MTSVSGTMFGSWTLSYDDESRLTSVTYPGGTDSFSCNALGQKMRAVLGGTAYRYVYNGDRVMEETNDAGTVTTRYMTESGSYYSPLINQFRTGCRCRWPLEDGAGTVRGLAANIGGEMSDWYELDAFGVELSSSGASRNDYRFGGAWGYMTDPSGLLQLGARYYWPELGRFIQQDPIGDGINWYAYVGNNPVVRIDPEGLDDIFIGVEGDLVKGLGGEFAFGFVYDTDSPCDSGFFGTGGPAAGTTMGVAINAGWSPRDIEGIGYGGDANLLGVSPTVSFDDNGFNGFGLGVGPGKGASASITTTSTYKARDAVADLRSLANDLKMIWNARGLPRE